MSDVKTENPLVHQRMLAVARELCELGMGKTHENRGQGFKYRGIDDVLQVLSPLLIKHGLVITPLAKEFVELATVETRNSKMVRVAVGLRYQIVCVEDNSLHEVAVWGEGADQIDKATNKAMANAYKYMAFQTFCIPVAGVLIDSEADEQEGAPVEPAPVDSRLSSLGAQLGLKWHELSEIIRQVTGKSFVTPREVAHGMTGDEREAVIARLNRMRQTPSVGMGGPP